MLFWLPAALLQVKALAGVTEANRKRAVIWASPPCTEYSLLKAGKPRDLEGADACVAVVGRIAADLDAAVVRPQLQQQQQQAESAQDHPAQINATNHACDAVCALIPATKDTLCCVALQCLLRARSALGMTPAVAALCWLPQVLIENPATGLLKQRDVIALYKHSYQLDYCQVGGMERGRDQCRMGGSRPTSHAR
jgi:hypothetical protein